MTREPRNKKIVPANAGRHLWRCNLSIDAFKGGHWRLPLQARVEGMVSRKALLMLCHFCQRNGGERAAADGKRGSRSLVCLWRISMAFLGQIFGVIFVRLKISSSMGIKQYNLHTR